MTAGEGPEKVHNKRESNWPNVLFCIHIHVLSLYGLYLALTSARILTNLFSLVLILSGWLGATSGAHRLWAHKTYRASTTLKVILMVCQTMVGQGSIYDWVVEHRLHHEHFGTENDPFNNKKGFAFAHFMTHLQHPSPNQRELMAKLDVSDLENDSVVMFQKRFYWILYFIVFLLLPINAPVEYWGESLMNSIFILGFLRYAFVLHGAWLINSATLIWGLEPGEKYPADTNLVFILTKSYWPQYHYLMPWDYKSGEFGSYGTGCSTTFIRVWAAMGWATGLRTMEPESIRVALTNAVTCDRPIIDCLREAEPLHPPSSDHFLVREDAK